MSGSTPAAAVQAHVDALQRIVLCVTGDVLSVRGGYYPSRTPHVLTFAAEPLARLRGSSYRALAIEHWYQITRADHDIMRAWRVETVAYMYTVFDAQGAEIFGYHWHPLGHSLVETPHLHLQTGARIGIDGLAGAHLPTGHVTLAQLIRCLIEELGVEPRRPDWRAVLDSAV